MEDKIGTLKELNLKPGDRVRNTVSYDNGVVDGDMIWRGDGCNRWCSVSESILKEWQVISRAADDRPKRWCDMTDAEKGALLLAGYEGREIEVYSSVRDIWINLEPGLDFLNYAAYRIKPDPVRETVKRSLHGSERMGYVAIDLVDGVPDWDSLRKWED